MRLTTLSKREGEGPRRRGGASAIEFAIIVPVLFLVLLGLIEVCRGLMVSHMLANAARQGCRVGILEGKGNNDVNAAVATAMDAGGLSGYQVAVQVNDQTADALNAKPDDKIAVTVSIPASATLWLPGATYLSGNLSGRYTLRKE